MKSMKKYEYDYFYKHTERLIISSAANWLNFLQMSANLYDMPFYAQIAVYFQMPLATKLDTYKHWKRQGRQVRRNEKSVSIYDYQTITKLFDISSTVSIDKNKDYIMWTVSNDDISKLANILSTNANQDLSQILSDLIDNGLTHNTDVFKPFIITSIKYIIDCRLNAPIFGITQDDFINLSFPQMKRDLHRAGEAICFVAADILKSIEKAIENIRETEYNLVIDTAVLNNEVEVENNVRVDRERAAADNLSSGRGHNGSGHNISRSERPDSADEIRPTEGEIYQGEKTLVFSGTLQDREAVATFDGYSEASSGERRTDHRTNDESRRGNRGAETEKPDALGTEGEQYTQQSARNSDRRSNSQLTIADIQQRTEPKRSVLFNERGYLNIKRSEMEDLYQLKIDNGVKGYEFDMNQLYAGDEVNYNNENCTITAIDIANDMCSLESENGIITAPLSTIEAVIGKRADLNLRQYSVLPLEPLDGTQIFYICDKVTGSPVYVNGYITLYNSVDLANNVCNRLNNNTEYMERISRQSYRAEHIINLYSVGAGYEVYNKEADVFANVLLDKNLRPMPVRKKNFEQLGIDNFKSINYIFLDNLNVKPYTEMLESAGYTVVMNDKNPVLAQSIPYIICNWSESTEFQEDTAYKVSEFDRIMAKADAEREKDGFYDKTNFSIVMPYGYVDRERQDIGDGIGGVIDYLKSYPSEEYPPVLTTGQLEITAALERHQDIILNENKYIGKSENYVKVTFTDNQYVLMSDRNVWLKAFGNNIADAFNYIVDNFNYINAKYLQIGEIVSNAVEEPTQIALASVGAFYEAYRDDANILSEKFNLTISDKLINGQKVPMVGFPDFALKEYVDILSADNIDVYIDGEKYIHEAEENKPYIEEVASVNNSIKYRISETKDEQYKFNVQVFTSVDDGKTFYYSGNGRFAETLDKAREYIAGEEQERIKDKADIEFKADDERFHASLVSVMENSINPSQPIIIGKTTNALAIAGANKELDLAINISTVRKCMAEPTERYHGHGLDIDIMSQIPSQLRNPVMILKGGHEGSVIAITELKDKKNREIMIALDIETAFARQYVNRITSVYGRNNMVNYLENQLLLENLIAVNIEKADKMLQSLGLQLPQEETFICFNDSIPYTMAEVKYPKTISSEITQQATETVLSVEATDFPEVSLMSDGKTVDIAALSSDEMLSRDKFEMENISFALSLNDGEIYATIPITRNDALIDRLSENLDLHYAKKDYRIVLETNGAINGTSLRLYSHNNEFHIVDKSILSIEEREITEIITEAAAVKIAEYNAYLEKQRNHQNDVQVQAASYSRYDGVICFIVNDKVYVGNEKNYDNKGNYDNSDNSLLYVSDNEKVFGYIRSEGSVLTQEEALNKGIFTTDDYKEFARVTEFLTQSGYVATKEYYFDDKPFDVSAIDGVIDNVINTTEGFVITDNDLGIGGAKAKYKANIAAISLLKKLEADDKIPTNKEQEILSRYVGWGGLSQVFDKNNASWSNEFNELNDLLTPEEYSSARASVNNAHYTSPTIIKAIYTALNNLGFKSGNILEPSMGIGNFFGVMPPEMRNSKIYGVELDDISGRLARKLYPSANIQITGFEKTGFSDNTFDVVIGNVPFGDYAVYDKDYNKHKFKIHDYFIAKSIDKVRAGGIVAVITSKGTMDKANSNAREYYAARADLLGAIRLPTLAFKANAGTEVTSDILFFQKREVQRDFTIEDMPDWVSLGTNNNGIKINKYFINNSDMIIGEMREVSGQFGQTAECILDDTSSFEEKLISAIHNIRGSISEIELSVDEELDTQTIAADPNIRNYSYTIVNEDIYYRNNSIMQKTDFSAAKTERIKGMIEIRDLTRELIDLQLRNVSDDIVKDRQKRLNKIYDAYVEKYGYLNSRGNRLAMFEDSSYPLLCSLENFDSEGQYIGKADMFTKRTINSYRPIDRVDTPVEALSVSMAVYGRVDLNYMAALCDNTTVDDIIERSKDIIFLNPETEKWETNDEYLSGNVRHKLAIAEKFAELDIKYQANVDALKKVQPVDLTADEIDVRLGATWIPPEYIRQFMTEVLQANNDHKVIFTPQTAEWNITEKNKAWLIYDNVLINKKYGTNRMNALEILEQSLNLKSVVIRDKDDSGKYITNKEATKEASLKQQELKDTFKDWIFSDIERRENLCTLYNEKFNCIRPREYDGSFLNFEGMNPEISLQPHQLNAVAHTLFGDNTLLAHAVGAGKTYEMAASAMESKRLGLCEKPLFVVPNHLTEQWASEFMHLYPAANILVSTKKDFEPLNRKKFCSKIATGNWDAVIIGHSQFEKIPISMERQQMYLQKEIDDITDAISLLSAAEGKTPSVKNLERSKKGLLNKLQNLLDSKKDDVVTFEELGVDRLYVDESHNYKNLFLYTKMTNVAGISSTDAKKSTDMFQKCRYIDEITGGKGIVFATGTPISNSMTEMYTNMKYLQYNSLQERGLIHFDAWASTFGETINSVELKPEGSGYQTKTRFSKFYNLPELMSMFKECADIKPKDTLNLPVPEAEYHNEVIAPTALQKELIASLAERAEKVRSGGIDSSEDNMLKITSDGRKIALDQRLYDPTFAASPNSKVDRCVENAYSLYKKYDNTKSTQLIFCDISTPKKSGEFSIYNAVKEKLISKGVPENEIAFIHDANTETQKKELFAKVRSGNVRFLLGSTSKMGAGTNVQDRLIGLHHLDVPWRPSDIEQQEGRILRQGNMHKKVHIFRYVTEGTFDSYSWQLIENKQKFISQIMTSKSPIRVAEDIDETTLSYAEVKALATGNPLIKEKMDLDIKISRLSMQKSMYNKQMYSFENALYIDLPNKITKYKSMAEAVAKDIDLFNNNFSENNFTMSVKGKLYTKSLDAQTAILNVFSKSDTALIDEKIGEYCGFALSVSYEIVSHSKYLILTGHKQYSLELSDSAQGNAIKLSNLLKSLQQQLEKINTSVKSYEQQLKTIALEIQKPFAHEDELKAAQKRLLEVEDLINTPAKEKNDNKIIGENIKDKAEIEQEPNSLKNLVANAEEKLISQSASSENISNQTTKKQDEIE